MATKILIIAVSCYHGIPIVDRIETGCHLASSRLSRKIFAWLLLPATLGCASGCVTAPPREPFEASVARVVRGDPLERTVRTLAQPLIDSHRNIGMVIAVSTPEGEGVYALGSQDLAGKVPMSRLDDMDHRILRSMFAAGVVDDPPMPRSVVDPFRGRDDARRIAAESIVLLKNEHQVLPLDAASIRSIVSIAGRRDPRSRNVATMELTIASPSSDIAAV